MSVCLCFPHRSTNRSSQSGATLVETALLIALVAVVAYTAIKPAGLKTADAMCRVAYALDLVNAGSSFTEAQLRSLHFDPTYGCIID
jgi:hypothetical protein